MESQFYKASEELKKLGLDLTQLLRDAHTETAIKLRSILEDFLETAIRARMVKNNEPIDERIFKANGELSNLAKKIKRAKRLNLIDNVAFKDVTLLRKIGNSFAHDREKINFDSAVIVACAKDLSTYGAAETNQHAILTATNNVTEQLKKSVMGP
jgi:DNA-binding MltR family transcriptional regulator